MRRPEGGPQIERARGRIVSVQLCDWVPLPADQAAATIRQRLARLLD